jgi:hypothetical protein
MIDGNPFILTETRQKHAIAEFCVFSLDIKKIVLTKVLGSMLFRKMGVLPLLCALVVPS